MPFASRQHLLVRLGEFALDNGQEPEVAAKLRRLRALQPYRSEACHSLVVQAAPLSRCPAGPSHQPAAVAGTARGRGGQRQPAACQHHRTRHPLGGVRQRRSQRLLGACCRLPVVTGQYVCSAFVVHILAWSGLRADTRCCSPMWHNCASRAASDEPSVASVTKVTLCCWPHHLSRRRFTTR